MAKRRKSYQKFFLFLFLSLVAIGTLVFSVKYVSKPNSFAATANNCTLYAAPNGNDNNDGRSLTTPKTLQGVSKITVPGDVVCLLDGTYNLISTFYPANIGNSTKYIVYRSYHDKQAIIKWVGVVDINNTNMFYVYYDNTHRTNVYLEFNGLVFDGGNIVQAGIFCQNAAHLRIINNYFKNQGESGFATKFCDYVYVDHNLVSHSGYNKGWSSAISLNSQYWSDQYQGFHSVVTNNIISGEYDNSGKHTDGNGIIMDLSNDTYDVNSANTPPALVANNVVYENGGYCIELFIVTNIWVVNNTCYKNGLDLSRGSVGEFNMNAAKNSYFINNIAYSWNNYSPYILENGSTNIIFSHNSYFGGTNKLSIASANDVNQLKLIDPQFTNPPLVDPKADKQYATALPPDQISDKLTLKSTSGAINQGIDPSTLANNDIVRADLLKYAGQDIRGINRPQGAAYDLGAYESNFIGVTIVPITQIPSIVLTLSPRPPTAIPTCTQPPACIFANPPCLIQTPAGGWCPVSPTPTLTLTPSPTCVPPPVCSYTQPFCLLPNPGNWCPPPTPSISPSPVATDCRCQTDNTCSKFCAFQGVGIQGPAHCMIGSANFTPFLSPPTAQDKTAWCNNPARVNGDTNNTGAVEDLDYFYFVRAINGGLIPHNIIADFNGDGEVGLTDRTILVSHLPKPTP